MFNNSIKRHSFRKSGYKREIHTFKKNEKLINGNYRIWENPRFLIWQPFWPWMTFITSWDWVSYVFTISKDTPLSYQHLIPNTHPYVWFKLSYECFRVPFLPLYLLFWPFWGLFTYIGVSKTWPHKKDVHHFWSLHPPWRYAPSVGLKHDTNGNFLALGLT